MKAPFPSEAKRVPDPAARLPRPQMRARRFSMPTAREMSPAECEAQRRLVRASVMAKPL